MTSLTYRTRVLVFRGRGAQEEIDVVPLDVIVLRRGLVDPLVQIQTEKGHIQHAIVMCRLSRIITQA